MTSNDQLTFTWPETWYEMGMEGIWKEKNGYTCPSQKTYGDEYFWTGNK